MIIDGRSDSTDVDLPVGEPVAAEPAAVPRPRSNEQEIRSHMAGRKLHLVRHGAVAVDLTRESSVITNIG